MFYALPQSPQLFKQMLMMAGFDRYYQIVKCFRDEDLRADRQPEFTQIDIETSFLDELEIREIMEGLVRTMFKEAIGVELPDPFPVMQFADAMRDYGSDKPDLRVPLKLTELTDVMRTVDFKVFRAAADLPNGRVAALRVPGGGTLTSKEIDDYTTFVKIYGIGGLAYIKVNDAGEAERGRPAIADRQVSVRRRCCATILERTGARTGDLIFFAADREKVVNDALGALRAKVGTERGLAEGGWKPLWVVDFPMFEYDDGQEDLGRAPPSVHRAQGRPRGAVRDRPGPRDREGLRRRAERLGDRRRLGAHSQARRAGEGVRRAQDQPRGPAQEVRLPARRAVLRRAAARRHRVRPRPARRDDGGRRTDPRRDRVPEDAARAGSARRRAQRRHRAAAPRSPHQGAADATRFARPADSHCARSTSRRMISRAGECSTARRARAMAGRWRPRASGFLTNLVRTRRTPDRNAACPVASHAHAARRVRAPPLFSACSPAWPSPRRPARHPKRSREIALADLPKEAREVYALVGKGGPFPFDRDGVVFGNREKLLPAKPRGYYHEYTVRTPGVKSRGGAPPGLRRQGGGAGCLLLHR